MNSALCEFTGYTSAYVTFDRELRTIEEASRDLRAIIASEVFVLEATPKLLELADIMIKAQDAQEHHQDLKKGHADKKREPDPRLSRGRPSNDKPLSNQIFVQIDTTT